MPLKPWVKLAVGAGIVSLLLIGRVHNAITCVLVLAWLSSIYLPRYMVNTLSIRRELGADRLFVGESTHLALHLENTGRLPLPWLLLRQNLPYNLADSSVSYSLDLNPGESQTVRVNLKAGARGYYDLGSLVWSVGDLFGMSEMQGESRFRDSLVVYPRVFRLDGWHLRSRIHLGRIRTGEVWYEDPARITGIRDYMPSDGLSRIHWKASAKAGSLQVKEFEPTVTATYQIILNLDEVDYRYNSVSHSDPELAIEFAASAASLLASQNSLVGLTTNGRDGSVPLQAAALMPSTIPPEGRNNTGAILEALARMRVEGACPPYIQTAMDGLAGLPRGSTCIFVTPRPCRELNDLARKAVFQGSRVAVFFIGKPKFDQVELVFQESMPYYWVEKVGKGDALAVHSTSGLRFGTAAGGETV